MLDHRLVPSIVPLDIEGHDDFVHIFFPDTPDRALCGADVTGAEFCGDYEGPECIVCADIARWWRQGEP